MCSTVSSSAIADGAGSSGFFHQTWSSQSLWQRITVQATDCPRISASFLEEERPALTDHYFRQEYMCEFLSHNRAVFNSGLIERFYSQNNFGPTKPILIEL